ncbi:MAG: porin [Nitrospirota bacterium]|nr:porin [Nitrospirota bacterium]
MKIRLMMFGFFVWMLAPSASAQTLDDLVKEIEFLKERISSLEQEVGRLQQREEINHNSQMNTAAIQLTAISKLTPLPAQKDYPKLILKPVPKPQLPDKLPNIEILFLTRTDLFENTEFKHSSTFLRKIEIGFSARINDWIGFRVEVDPVKPNDPFRRTFIQFTPHKYVDLRVGQEKAPLGMEELMRTSRVPFADRSDVSDRFAPAEELGVVAYLGNDRLKLGFSVTDGRKRQKIESQRDDNDLKDFTGRLAFKPLNWVELGIARMDGRVGTDKLERNRTNISFRLGDRNNINFLYGEYFNAEDGEVESDAFHVAAGKGFKLNNPYIDTIVPAFRYEKLTQEGRLNFSMNLNKLPLDLIFGLNDTVPKLSLIT